MVTEEKRSSRIKSSINIEITTATTTLNICKNYTLSDQTTLTLVNHNTLNITSELLRYASAKQ